MNVGYGLKRWSATGQALIACATASLGDEEAVRVWNAVTQVYKFQKSKIKLQPNNQDQTSVLATISRTTSNRMDGCTKSLSTWKIRDQRSNYILANKDQRSSNKPESEGRTSCGSPRWPGASASRPGRGTPWMDQTINYKDQRSHYKL